MRRECLLGSIQFTSKDGLVRHTLIVRATTYNSNKISDIQEIPSIVNKRTAYFLRPIGAETIAKQ